MLNWLNEKGQSYKIAILLLAGSVTPCPVGIKLQQYQENTTHKLRQMSYRNWVLICLWSNVVKVVIFQPKAILLVYSTLDCEFGWPKVTFQGFLNYEKRQGGMRLSKISLSNLWNIFVSLQKLWTLPWRTKIIKISERFEEGRNQTKQIFSFFPAPLKHMVWWFYNHLCASKATFFFCHNSLPALKNVNMQNPFMKFNLSFRRTPASA